MAIEQVLATPRTVATTTKEGAIVRCGNITRKELGQILVGAAGCVFDPLA